MKLSIGVKLGAASALGILSTVALVAVQYSSMQSIDFDVADTERRQIILMESLNAKAELGQAQAAIKNVRLATTGPQIQENLNRLEVASANSLDQLGKSKDLVRQPGEKAAIDAAAERLVEYFTAGREIAKAQYEAVNLVDERAKWVAEWSEQVGQLEGVLEQSIFGREVKGLIDVADNAVSQVQLAALRYSLRPAPQLRQALVELKGKVEMALLTAMQRSDDQGVRDRIDGLSKTFASYHAAAVRALQVEDQKEEVQTRRAVPSAEAALKQLSDVVATARERSEATTKQIHDSIASALTMGLLLGLAVCAVLLGSAAYGFLSISRPIGRIAAILSDLGKGNTDIVVPSTQRSDEIGEAARAAESFKLDLIRLAEMEAEKKQAEAKSQAERKATMLKMADDFDRAIGSIVETVSSAAGQLEKSALSLTETAEETKGQSLIVASASQQTSANVQGVAAAAEELAATVTEISRQVQDSSTLATQAVAQAGATSERINELLSSANRIGDVVDLINSIASQTNLLALNATIEAARAGDAGKGFAVVAQEVKTLAEETAKATSDIASQINGMQAATTDAVKAISDIASTISRLSNISGHIAAAVAQQDAAASEISRNVTEAANGTNEVASSITEVSDAAVKTGSNSTQVLESAKQLSVQSSTLRSEVERLLSTVRAA